MKKLLAGLLLTCLLTTIPALVPTHRWIPLNRKRRKIPFTLPAIPIYTQLNIMTAQKRFTKA